MIERSWLVQRLIKPIPGLKQSPFAFGGGMKNGGLSDAAMDILKDIFFFDYMGSAEFEFGRLREVFFEIAVYGVVEGSLENPKVYYLCRPTHEEYVRKFIKDLSKGDIHLKSRSGFKESIVGEEWAKQYVGWIELDNGFFFFTDKEMCDKTKTMFKEVKHNMRFPEEVKK